MARFVLGMTLTFALFVSVPLSAQRGGGGGGGRSGSLSTANTPHTTVDPGARYGIGANNAPPATNGSSQYHAGDEPPVEFRTETVLVQVPTIVIDKAGNHVHGLTRENFHIFENGKEQKIANLEEFTANHAPLPLVKPNAGEFSNLDAVNRAPTSIAIIALDTINTPFSDQAWGRKQLVTFLADHVEATQPTALLQIGSNGMKVISWLTTDPNTLLTALKKVKAEIPAMQGTDVDSLAASATGDVAITASLNASPLAYDLTAPNGVDTAGNLAVTLGLQEFILSADAGIIRMQQNRAIEITLNAFLDIARSVSGIPGRKALIWATGSFPFVMDNYSAVPGGYLAVLYERTMQALNDAQVSIYPVDVRGLVNTSTTADATYAGLLTGPGMTHSIVARSWLQSTTIDTLKDIAEMTGGQAFYNNNDVASGIRRAVDDSAEYYVLSYYLDTSNNKAGWRQLKLKVDKPGVELRTRSGFFMTNATSNPAATRDFDVKSALSSPFDATGIPMTVQWRDASAEGEKKKVGFQIHLAGGSILIEEAHSNHFDLEFDAVAFQKGEAAGSFGKVMAGTINANALASVKETGVGFHDAIDLSPGNYTVRFVVRDNLTGKVGSVSAPLTVN
jgi:VWFA-related protein